MLQKLNTIFLNDYYNQIGGKFSPFAGYSMPINFSNGIINEHMITRSKCGLFDVSHMGQMLILSNEQNLNLLETIIPHNLKSLSISKSIYSFILNSKGCIIDDLIISKIIIDSFEYLFLIYNASRKNIDEKIIANLISKPIVIKNRSLIALQGPYSYKIISKVFPLANKLSFMQIGVFKFNDKNILISRTGYTGEDGFELSIPNNLVMEIIHLFSKNFNNIHCGLGSRDSLRLEAGLCLYGNELNEDISPIEAKLNWAIPESRLIHGGFLGHKKILNDIKFGTANIRVGLESLTKSILRSKMTIHNIKGQKIGNITSGGFSPILNKSIAMAYIKNNSEELSNDIFCLIRNKMELVKITKIPFVKHNYIRR